MYKISVIIPVYNTAIYLKQCLNSVINQSLKDIQIILINDGSTDNSGDICRDYQKMDPRIVYIESDNKGQGNARNIGVSLAEAEYIMFVDSDDFLELNTMENYFSFAKSKNADICDFNYFLYDDSFNKDITVFKHEVKFEDAVNVNSHREVLSLMSPVLCTKIIRKEIVTKNNIHMKNHMCEDMSYLAQIYLHSDRICQTDFAGYHYRFKRPGNLSLNMDRYYELNKSISELITHAKQWKYWSFFWSDIFQLSFKLYKDMLNRVNGIREDISGITQKRYSDLLDSFYLSIKNNFQEKVDLSFLKKRYMIFGSYNLRLAVHFILLENNMLLKDYSASTIESVISNDCSKYFENFFSFTINKYRSRLIKQDLQKDFFNELIEIKPDILLIDLLEEINDLIVLDDNSVFTRSDYLPNYICSSLPIKKHISILSPERDNIFFNSASKFCELLNKSDTQVFVIENYLCEKHSDRYDQREDFPRKDYICKINKKLKEYYSFIEKQLHSPIIVSKQQVDSYRFTVNSFEYGCVPYYYNDAYYHKIALEICKKK